MYWALLYCNQEYTTFIDNDTVHLEFDYNVSVSKDILEHYSILCNDCIAFKRSTSKTWAEGGCLKLRENDTIVVYILLYLRLFIK